MIESTKSTQIFKFFFQLTCEQKERPKYLVRHCFNGQADRYNRSTLNMLIESRCTTSYLMAIVMFPDSVTILELFTIEMCMILNLTF